MSPLVVLIPQVKNLHLSCGFDTSPFEVTLEVSLENLGPLAKPVSCTHLAKQAQCLRHLATTQLLILALSTVARLQLPASMT